MGASTNSQELAFDYDDTNFMRPWTMRSDRADLTFTPLLERTARTNLLLIRSEVHQLFGHYSGTVVDDLGGEITLTECPGVGRGTSSPLVAIYSIV